MNKKQKKKKDERLYEYEIKKAFINNNYNFFFSENTFLINEMKLNSKNIIDLIHFDFNKNIIIGFELKSERDTIRRLNNQLKCYNTFCNVLYVVCHEKHTNEVIELINNRKQYKNVGIISTTRDLKFKEIKQGIYQKPRFDSFIRNLDTEELINLYESKKIKLPLINNKKFLVDRLKTQVDFSEIYNSLKNKILKYYITGNKCLNCNQEIYYNKLIGYTKDKYCLLCNRLIE